MAQRGVGAGVDHAAVHAIRTLVKGKRVNQHDELVVNYDEVGPGYLSAYGLVAAYNVVPGKNGRPDWDNGVRVHGSSEILSIRNPEAYSHGCHRLMNHLAVRMFRYVLPPAGDRGRDRPLDFARQFLWKEQVRPAVAVARLLVSLEPPLPVNVLEGNIAGKGKETDYRICAQAGREAILGPIPIPKDSPEARAGGD